MYFAYKMPELSLAFQQIYIHSDSICLHLRYSVQCVHRHTNFSVYRVCLWAGVGLSHRGIPRSLACARHTWALSVE